MAEESPRDDWTPEEDAVMQEAWEEQKEQRRPTALPADGDQLLKTDPDHEREFVLRTFKQSQTYITGYIWAADHLYAEAQRSAQEAKEARESGRELWAPMKLESWLVYPIYFLYRHAIELSLKDILRTAQERAALKPEQEELINHCHDVYKLWEILKPWVMNFAQDGLIKETPAFESMLKEIQTHDSKGEAGRYDMREIGKKKTKQLVATFQGLGPLDVNSIHYQSHKILNYIRWILTLYEEHQQHEDDNRWWLEQQS